MSQSRVHCSGVATRPESIDNDISMHCMWIIQTLSSFCSDRFYQNWFMLFILDFITSLDSLSGSKFPVDIQVMTSGQHQTSNRCIDFYKVKGCISLGVGEREYVRMIGLSDMNSVSDG